MSEPMTPAPAGSPAGVALDPEDAKLVVLARSARARIGAIDGAAVRDSDGRTYAGASMTLPSLSLSALQVAVALAVSSGATKLEAAAVVTEASTVDNAGHAVVRDLSGDAPIYLAAPDGTVLGVVVE